VLSLEKTATGTFLILGEKREFTYQEDGGFKQVGVEKMARLRTNSTKKIHLSSK
jgi:hypothetical protein